MSNKNITDEYDYNRYVEILHKLLDTMDRDTDRGLEIGENISGVPAIKIIFDGYADLDILDENGDYLETREGEDRDHESYAIFIHRDSAQPEFEFPEHDMTPWCLIHRPREEVCIHAWFDVKNQTWTIAGLEETSDRDMTNQQVMIILEKIWCVWFENEAVPYEFIMNTEADGQTPTVSSWPFPAVEVKK